MKPIKVTLANAALIDAALRATNGTATAHTFTADHQIIHRCCLAEVQLVAMLAKKDIPGAVLVAISGGKVANAYKYTRLTTSVTVQRRTAGWYITEIVLSESWSAAGGNQLTLTPAQDAAAIRRFRTYAVAPAAPPPASA